LITVSRISEEAPDSKMLTFFSQNDDEDLVFMYNAYLHKLMTSFLSQPAGREKASLTLSFSENHLMLKHRYA
jgi:hypothetical protein